MQEPSSAIQRSPTLCHWILQGLGPDVRIRMRTLQHSFLKSMIRVMMSTSIPAKAAFKLLELAVCLSSSLLLWFLSTRHSMLEQQGTEPRCWGPFALFGNFSTNFDSRKQGRRQSWVQLIWVSPRGGSPPLLQWESSELRGELAEEQERVEEEQRWVGFRTREPASASSSSKGNPCSTWSSSLPLCSQTCFFCWVSLFHFLFYWQLLVKKPCSCFLSLFRRTRVAFYLLAVSSMV